jgi:putative membrane protein
MRGNWSGPGREPFADHLGGMSTFGMVLMIILWIAVIAAIVIGIRALVLHSRRSRAVAAAAAVAPAAGYPPAGPSGPAPAAAPSLLAILEERYARGEIDRGEFLQRKQDLGLTGPPAVPTAEAAPSSTTPSAPESTN